MHPTFFYASLDSNSIMCHTFSFDFFFAGRAFIKDMTFAKLGHAGFHIHAIFFLLKNNSRMPTCLELLY